jgi:L-ascorbate metabolism protein UlaG (beta-lactamase superfamily)
MPDIQYLGHAAFRLRGREGIVVTDPYERSTGRDIGRPNAHIVTTSHAHPGHSNTAAVRPIRERLFVASGPGEYEIGGVLLTGIRTFHDKQRGAQHGANTVFVVHLDDIAFCHLGDLGHELNAQHVEDIGNIDVLFVPISGDSTITLAEVVGVIAQLEPRIVIPMHFDAADKADGPGALERFLTEMGSSAAEPVDRLTVTPTTLGVGSTTRVIVMTPVV